MKSYKYTQKRKNKIKKCRELDKIDATRKDDQSRA
jgi:hypothetical protein